MLAPNSFKNAYHGFLTVNVYTSAFSMDAIDMSVCLAKLIVSKRVAPTNASNANATIDFSVTLFLDLKRKKKERMVNIFAAA